ncbi:MAG: prepilin-type N-terminal cleavage/methylation domain-containing protein [Micromonosporaceae bacterium]|nr:prepilin-type N-terminal cleavage/methylation domain-containing protein [Micromonosporaceae bacterium]
MQARFRRIRQTNVSGDHGFTLIEMLVVVVIIGILAGIAIPVYMNYRKGAQNKSAESDVRGAISAVEQFYTENGNQYPINRNGTTGNNVPLTLANNGGVAQQVTVSPGNAIYFRNYATYYVICGWNTSGRTVYVYNSSSGRPVGTSQQTTLATCATNGN